MYKYTNVKDKKPPVDVEVVARLKYFDTAPANGTMVYRPSPLNSEFFYKGSTRTIPPDHWALNSMEWLEEIPSPLEILTELVEGAEKDILLINRELQQDSRTHTVVLKAKEYLKLIVSMMLLFLSTAVFAQKGKAVKEGDKQYPMESVTHWEQAIKSGVVKADTSQAMIFIRDSVNGKKPMYIGGKYTSEEGFVGYAVKWHGQVLYYLGPRKMPLYTSTAATISAIVCVLCWPDVK